MERECFINLGLYWAKSSICNYMQTELINNVERGVERMCFTNSGLYNSLKDSVFM